MSEVSGDGLPDVSTRPDVGEVDVPKTKCECDWCIDPETRPLPVVITCPECGEEHVDAVDPVTGIDWSKRKHHEHQCSVCKYLWTPALIPTVGVKSL